MQFVRHRLQATLTDQRDPRPDVQFACRHLVDQVQDESRAGDAFRSRQPVTQSAEIGQRELALDDAALRRLHRGIQQRFPGGRHGGGMIVIRVGGVKVNSTQIIVF